jgi:hypothetical protein
VKSFGRFWWDFLVGDDPKLAAAIVLVLGGGAVAVAVTTGSWVAVLVGSALVAAFVVTLLIDVRL